MPKILEALPPSKRATKAEPKYPFDEWLDGKARLFEHGTDFKTKTAGMIQNFYKAAKARNIKVAIRIVDKKSFAAQAKIVTPA